MHFNGHLFPVCSIDNKSAKELRQYLAHLSEQAAAGDNSVLPCVVVLDNLHKAGSLADALGSLPRNLPCLIGELHFLFLNNVDIL